MSYYSVHGWDIIGICAVQEVSNIDSIINGSDVTINQRVLASTRANNPVPAIGGVGLPSIDEIRHNIIKADKFFE